MKNIYVIDDSISVCIAIEKMLRDQGFEVRTERSGIEAIAYLHEARPDLVICDLVLPDINGTEICTYISRDPRFTGMPVIAISGLVDAQVQASAQRAGATRVMKKPFSPEELLSAIKEGLDAQESPAAAVPPPPAASLPVDEPMIEEIAIETGALPSLRFGLIVDMDGRLVRRIGAPHPGISEVVEALIEIVRRSASVAEWLEQTDPYQLLFQADDGLILTQRFGDYLVVLVLSDSSVLGKTRFTLARLRRRYASGNP